MGHVTNKGLLTEREICTVKYRTDRSAIFHCADRTREVSKLLIIWLAAFFQLPRSFCI